MSDAPFAKYASVILDLSIDKALDYGLSEEQASIAKRGMRVEVPVKGHLRSGYIQSIKDTADYPRIQPVKRIAGDAETVTPDLFELALWMSKYYCATLREAFQMMLPAPVRKGKAHKQQFFVVRAKTREELRDYCEKIRNKSPGQAAVLDAMLMVVKGILLSELLEETGGTRSPVDTLVKRGLLHIDIVRVDRSPLQGEEYFKTKPKQLNDDQKAAFEKIAETISEGGYKTHLIHGITGSGKTEIYLQAIERTLALGKTALMLVPEISLTPQMVERFRSRFEGQIALLHHRLSDGERLDEWHRIRRGDAKIAIGARSAVFSPLPNLGLIIVDEEHEHSYKQSDSAPCYHAREVAVMRGSMAKCTVVLGSATPSLESYYNAVNGKYTLSTLGIRADSAALPKFTIVDMKREYEKSKGYTSFSDLLLNGIEQRRLKGEQTILFLNRRGYHTQLQCQGCGKAATCAHCAVSLAYHQERHTLVCHQCGYAIPPPESCPTCGSPTVRYRGVGTELIEKSLHAILPEVRTLRVDTDTTRHKGSHQKLLRDFGTGKADVLIGTQMIAKGLHFPEVTLVGVLNSDMNLNIPDFRSSENTFQLITQVAGRAGRGHVRGEVVVQTCLPDHPTICLAAQQDYTAFYKEEIEVRRLFNYPPFSSLAKLTFSGNNELKTRKYAETFRTHLSLRLPPTYELFAVIPSGHAKLKDEFRFQLLIKGPAIYPLSFSIAQVRTELPPPRGIRLLPDINPTSTFF